MDSFCSLTDSFFKVKLQNYRMRKNLEMYYFSDPDHKIEHTIEEFKSEMHQSELRITSLKTIWGEIWAVCER